ncbi:MAG: lytic transglycosylase domain-containing protein [Spirochaetaceae bacterium]|nr:lytic transglycosylase domain-containing protein [Spirochaetaceae bacterium]
MSIQSAENRLSKKQVVFLIDAVPERLPEIAKIDPSAPFYAALLLEDVIPGDEKIAKLLAIAAKSPIVRTEAVKKLAVMDADSFFEESKKNPDLASGTVWGDAFTLVDKITGTNFLLKNKGQKESYSKEILDFFLSAAPGAAQKWAYEKLSGEDFPVGGFNILSETELAAVRGHFSVSKSSYNEAIKEFKTTLKTDKNIFLSYRELLSDLGKAYQYTTPKDGVELFSVWETDLNKKDTMPDSNITKDEARYLLLFYCGKMKRQIKAYGDAANYFSKALDIAPDNLQSDACIWYLIDMGWTESAAKALAALNKYAPLWHDPLYFSDIFDKISLYYTTRKRWDSLTQFLPAVRLYADDESLAKYAYLIGRAFYFGLISEEKAAQALAGSIEGKPIPEDFYKIAYNSKDYRGTALTPFYYHSVAAQHLSKRSNFQLPKKSPPAAVAKDAKDAKESDTFLFLNNFFRFGCAEKVYPYIRSNMSNLTIEELRSLALKLEGKNQYGDAIRLSVAYMGREDYVLNRADLEICYPKAFKEVIDSVSSKTGMSTSLLYALIRTESIFIPDITSHAGAMGLTQLMPKTGAEMARQLSKNSSYNYVKDGKLDYFDPKTNVHIGAAYYMQLYERLGSRLLALLSYNGGIGRVMRWRNNNRDLSEDLLLETIELTETREYGKKVLAAEAVYDFLY